MTAFFYHVDPFTLVHLDVRHITDFHRAFRELNFTEPCPRTKVEADGNVNMKFIKFLAPPLLLFIWGDIVVLQAIKLKNFYPFGQSEGDQVVPPNDDGGSGRVPISFPFPFFGQDHLSLFVSIVLFHENLIRSHSLSIMGN